MTKDRKKYLFSIKDNEFNFSNKKSIKFWLHVIWNTFIEFCNGTNIHGFPQICDSDHDMGKPKLSKILHKISIAFWSTMVIIGISFGIYLVHMVLSRYYSTPTITTIETSNYPVSNLPFPSVALCNVNPIWKPNTENISKKLMNENIDKNRIAYFLGNLSNLITLKLVDADLYTIFDLLETKYNYTADTMMEELVQPCDKLLFACFWLSRQINCSLLFRMVKTELGYCCIFNYKADSDTIENGHELLRNETPEIRIAGAGEDIGLRVYMRIDESEYISPREFYSGVETIVFGPYDYPPKNFIAAVSQPGYETAVGMKPTVLDSNFEFDLFPESKRACLLFEEGNLTISRRYTYYTCIVQCRANLILSKCNCLPFFYPNSDYLSNNFNYRKCTFRDLNCLNTYKYQFHSLDISEASKYDRIIKEEREGLKCNCLPSCKVTAYNTETFGMKRMNGSKRAIFNSIVPPNNTGDQLGLIKVYYKQLTCIKYQRKVYMTWDNLLATIGGIYGLCLGGSVLSIVQIAYYVIFKSIEIYFGAEQEKEEKKLSILIAYYSTDYPKPRYIPVYLRHTHMKKRKI